MTRNRAIVALVLPVVLICLEVFWHTPSAVVSWVVLFYIVVLLLALSAIWAGLRSATIEETVAELAGFPTGQAWRVCKLKHEMSGELS
jgi:hypothetical protein